MADCPLPALQAAGVAALEDAFGPVVPLARPTLTGTLVPSPEPTPAMVEAGVAFAMRAKLGGDYRWPDYIADLWRTMAAARA